jgi:hypothetical protein
MTQSGHGRVNFAVTHNAAHRSDRERRRPGPFVGEARAALVTLVTVDD